jgi:hypothetical protein
VTNRSKGFIITAYITDRIKEGVDMEKIKVILNRESNTLDVWFDDVEKEFICEETGEEVILKKDKDNRVIGFGIVPFQVNIAAIITFL